MKCSECGDVLIFHPPSHHVGNECGDVVLLSHPPNHQVGNECGDVLLFHLPNHHVGNDCGDVLLFHLPGHHVGIKIAQRSPEYDCAAPSPQKRSSLKQLVVTDTCDTHTHIYDM